MAAVLRRVRAACRWWWDLVSRISRLEADERVMLVTALSALEHDAFVHARTAVRETSQILGFRDPAMWKGLSRHMKDDGVKAENVFRHMEAVRRLREKHPEPIRHHIANLLVEMAYHGYSELKR